MWLMLLQSLEAAAKALEVWLALVLNDEVLPQELDHTLKMGEVGNGREYGKDNFPMHLQRGLE